MDAKVSIVFRRLKDNTVLIHTLIGILAGYFLLHPITMVIYWFEISDSAITIKSIMDAFAERLLHTFQLHMMPMSFVFIILGAIAGLGSGLYFTRINKQGREIQIKQLQLNESIGSIIKGGENENVEFKKSFRYDYRIGHPEKSMEDMVMHTVAGFMNAKGGILIIGVDSDGHIKGLANDYFSLGRKSREGFDKRFIEVLASKLGTEVCSLVHLAFHEIADWEICSVLIEKANHPVFMGEGDNPVFYLRIGNITRPLNTRETLEYLKSNRSKSKH